MLNTVQVPKKFEPIFRQAQEYVTRYFGEKRELPEKGSIDIGGQRYVMVRAAALSVEFFEAVKNLYLEDGEQEALRIARDLLFDIAHSIGKADARDFHKRMGLKDPVEKLSAGPIHFAYMGWAFVNILPASNPVADENYYLIYDHPYSFEAASWIKSGRKVDFPVCIMNAGYSSGWCEESFGIELIASEISCRAKGDEQCRFIMAPPTKIEGYIKEYLRQGHGITKGAKRYEIPSLYLKKELKDKLATVRRSEEKYRGLFVNMNEGVAVHKLLYDAGKKPIDYVIKDVNPQFESIMGIKREEALDQRATALYGTRKAPYLEVYSQVAETGQPTQFETYFPPMKKHFSISVFSLNKGEFGTIFADITKRKRAEEELQVEKAYFERLFESSPEAIVVVDGDGRVVRVNSEFSKMFGYEADETLGKLIDKLLAPEGLSQEALSLTKKVLGGEKIFLEGVRRRKDGTSVEVSILGTPINVGKRGKAGYAIYRDITERKRAEEERAKLEHQLRQSQKMEAIGTLASGIAHDFNNLLGGILGYSSLLLSKLPNEDTNRKYVELIERAGNRAAELTNRLLGFARRGKYEVKPVDVNQLIRGVVELLSASIDKKIKIKTELCGENPCAKGDLNQLEQVLMNLCVNARDAMPGGGELSICSEVAHLDKKFVSKHLGATPGDYVRLSISDTGMGIDEETMAKIFDPFFTTKEQGRGTGLGLAMVYGVVKNHGGYISCHSRLGKGTTFEVYLPLAQRALSQPRKGRVEPISGSESILVIDDEEILRNLMKDILEDLGYGVMLASDGREAVEIYRKQKKGIDLVIVDMMMPVMGGRETYQELRRINPEVKTLLASGYSQDSAAQQILDLGVKDFLHKPFSLEEISHKVREVLDAR